MTRIGRGWTLFIPNRARKLTMLPHDHLVDRNSGVPLKRLRNQLEELLGLELEVLPGLGLARPRSYQA